MLEDPWIGLEDHPNGILYGENKFGGSNYPHSKLNSSCGGALVFINSLNGSENIPLPENSVGIIFGGGPWSWDKSLEVIKEQGGEMFTNMELLEAIRVNGTLLPGQD